MTKFIFDMPPKHFFDPHLRRRAVVSADDGLSFVRALVIAIAYATLKYAVDYKETETRVKQLKKKYHNLCSRPKQQLLEAHTLMRKCGLGTGPYEKKDLEDVAAKYPCFRFELFEVCLNFVL